MRVTRIVPALVVLATLAGFAGTAFAAGSQDASAAPAERPKIVFMRSNGSNPYAVEAKPDDKYYKEVSRLSGVDFSFESLEHNNQNQLLSLRFASGDLPDVFITGSVDSQFHPGAVQSGAFVDLTDLIPKHAPNMWAGMPEAYSKNPNVSYSGRIYGIPWLQPLPAVRVVYYRKDWLDELGMKPPVTLDDYLPIFARIKAADLNGNATPTSALRGARELRLQRSSLGILRSLPVDLAGARRQGAARHDRPRNEGRPGVLEKNSTRPATSTSTCGPRSQRTGRRTSRPARSASGPTTP